MGEIFAGKIMKIEGGRMWIVADAPPEELAAYRKYRDVLIECRDGRLRSLQQLRKAYVLLNAISAWSGYTPVEATKEMMKMAFRASAITLQEGLPSLATMDMTECRHFIDFLVRFCIENNVPLYKVGMYDLAEDIPAYIYQCLLHKRCAVCGQRADLHHVDRIGMGGNRHTTGHLGRRALPLCREHHTILHTMPEQEFMAQYHLVPIPIDHRIAKVYRLNERSEKDASDSHRENP